jgi:hypothetical protein
MGGTIWVESEAGTGSTFHFTMMLPWAPLEPEFGECAAEAFTESAPLPGAQQCAPRPADGPLAPFARFARTRQGCAVAQRQVVKGP